MHHLCSLHFQKQLKCDTINTVTSQVHEKQVALLCLCHPQALLSWVKLETLFSVSLLQAFFPSFFFLWFFFSVGKVIWNHDSSKQCPTFDYGILKWKKNISCWHHDAYPGWLTAPGKKSNLIGLNFEVTKSLHTTRIFLSFCNGNHTLIGTETLRGSGWLKELIWLLFHWRVRQQQVQWKSNLRDL